MAQINIRLTLGSYSKLKSALGKMSTFRENSHRQKSAENSYRSTLIHLKEEDERLFPKNYLELDDLGITQEQMESYLSKVNFPPTFTKKHAAGAILSIFIEKYPLNVDLGLIKEIREFSENDNITMRRFASYLLHYAIQKRAEFI